MKKQILALTLTVSMLLPFPVGADTTTCVINVLDTVAGLGTEVTASHCTKNDNLSLTVISPGGTSSGLVLRTDASGNGHVSIDNSLLSKAGTYRLQSPTGTIQFDVLSEGPDPRKSFLSATDGSILADGHDQVTITATLRDKFGNPLSGRPVALLSNRSDDDINATQSETDSQGEMSWRVASRTSGVMTLTAYDILSTVAINDRIDVRVGNGIDSLRADALTGTERGGDFGSLDHFDVHILGKDTVRVNEDISLEITALDRSNQVVEDFAGSVTFTSTDTEAVLPGDGKISFKPAELGAKRISLGLRFRTSGDQTLTVRDSQSNARGSLTVSVTRVDSNAGGEIQIIDPPQDAHVPTTTVLIQGKAPSLVNLKVVGGSEDAFGASDAEGVFRISVHLKEGQTDHTLFIVSDNGRYQSEPHHLVLDTSKPAISGITFDPATGIVGDMTTITVKAEAGLRSMRAIIGPQTVDIAESDTDKGTYTASFTAPEAKTYDVKITANDTSGNATEMLTKWTVTDKGADQVQNVKTQSLPNAVMLTWDKVQGDVAQYKIYVGETSDNYAFTLETGAPINSARVNGLAPGKTYYFALTAVNKNGAESNDKSTPVTGMALGMSVTVTAGPESVLLQWEPPASTPLAGYVLEYGVDPNRYTETRVINDALRAYTIRDLLDNVTYQIRLTPVTVSGQKIPELAAVVYGTPNGEGFGHGSPDPAPFPTGGTPHGGAPNAPPYRSINSGLPSPIVWSLAGVVLLGTAFAFWRRRQHKTALAFIREMDRRYTS